MASSKSQISPDPIAPVESVDSGFLGRMLAAGNREALFWILHATFWVVIGIVGFLMTRALQSTVPEVGSALFARMASGFVLTAGLRYVYRQSWWRLRGDWMKWTMMAGCCLAVGFAEAVVLQAMMVAGLAIPGGSETFGLKLILVRFFVLVIWSTLYFAFHLMENAHAMELRVTRAELAARENELRHLQAQMNPHFVFNSLNAVMASRNDPEAVREVTASLAEYLRFLLQETRPFKPLSRELDALEKFLVVQTSHFNKNLVCRVQCDSAARAVMVPPMIIQPLIENAFQHRPENQDLPLQIWLTARVKGGFLDATLSSTGQLVQPSKSDEASNGIPSLRQRLKLLLGKEARVDQLEDSGWIRVTILIPLDRTSRS